MIHHPLFFFFFFFNDTATTEIYTLSLHDALPIYSEEFRCLRHPHLEETRGAQIDRCPGRHRGDSRGDQNRFCHGPNEDRKSTRLNSSHTVISYAVFCLKKKKKKKNKSLVGRQMYC